MANSAIEWTDKTWNPTTGCDKISPGCAHCYAEGVADRFWATQYAPVEFLETVAGDGYPKQRTATRPRTFTDVLTHADRLDQPLHWKKPARIFVNSMSDLFHEDVPNSFVDQVFAVMALARQHTFQVLTKRPERMRAYVSSWNGWGCGVWFAAEKLKPSPPPQHWYHAARTFAWPLPNVWLGVSVENQHFADERIPLLLQTPAAVRFISAEPLLGPVYLSIPTKTWGARSDGLPGCDHCCTGDRCDDCSHHDRRSCRYCRGTGAAVKLDWVIVGGESGAGARPFDVQWARSIVEQCKTAGVPVFVKQLGACVQIAESPLSEWPGSVRLISEPNGHMGRCIALGNRKGGDMAEWPDDLRVREFPSNA